MPCAERFAKNAVGFPSRSYLVVVIRRRTASHGPSFKGPLKNLVSQIESRNTDMRFYHSSHTNGRNIRDPIPRRTASSGIWGSIVGCPHSFILVMLSPLVMQGVGPLLWYKNHGTQT